MATHFYCENCESLGPCGYKGRERICRVCGSENISFGDAASARAARNEKLAELKLAREEVLYSERMIAASQYTPARPPKTAAEAAKQARYAARAEEQRAYYESRLARGQARVHALEEAAEHRAALRNGAISSAPDPAVHANRRTTSIWPLLAICILLALLYRACTA